MSLPPIAPPPAAAAPRLQPRKEQRQQRPSPPAAAPRKAPVPAAASAPAKPPRKGRGAPFSSSWPSASLQRQLPRSRAAPGSRRLGASQAAAVTAAPASGLPPPPPSPARGRSLLALPGSGARSCESLGAAQGGRGEAALRFSLSLPPEAIRVLQRRSLEKQPRPRARPPGHDAAATKPLSAAGGDWRALLKVSLLNERHRYDDVEYEEEAPAASGACKVDEGLVRKCTEWLRGVESAAARDQGSKLETLPHLSTL